MDFPITPEKIRAASEATGIKLVLGSWATVDDDGERCGCGLSVLVAQKIGWESLLQFTSDWGHDGEAIESFVGNYLGLTINQVNSFTMGFDGHEGYHSEPECDTEAYFAGLQCWSELNAKEVG